jgi:hypothetical protein
LTWSCAGWPGMRGEKKRGGWESGGGGERRWPTRDLCAEVRAQARAAGKAGERQVRVGVRETGGRLCV